MSEREDDLRLERELREVLRGRDPGPAPYGLRGRVDRVPEEGPRPSGRQTAGRALAWAGSIAAGIAATAVVVAASRARDSGAIGASPDAATGVPDPLGPGVVPYPPIEMFGYAAAVLAVSLVALGIGLLVLRRRSGRIPLVLGVLIPVLAAVLALMPGVVADESGGTMVQPVVVPQMPAGYTGSRMLYLVAGPTETYDLEIGIRNSGPLPVTVHGVFGRTDDARLNPHWVEVRLVPEPRTPSPVTGDPFAPFTLAPGGWMGVRLVGNPGPCAVGGSFDQATADTLQYQPVTFTVSYDILGWPRADRLSDPSSQLLVPYRGDCDPSAAASASATP